MSSESIIPLGASAGAPGSAPAGDVCGAPAETAIASSAPSSKRLVARGLITVAVLLGAVLAIQFSPVRALLRDTVRVRHMIEAMGHFAYPACLIASAVLIGSGFPRLVVCTVASMVLGFGWGLFVSQGGALLGYYAVFCFIRWGGSDWVTHRWPRLCALAERIQDQGVLGVLLARQLPIHGTLINLCLGLSRVKQRHFLIGTAIGLLPEAIPVALVGAGLVQSSLGRSAGVLGLAVLAFGVLWIASAYALGRGRQPGKSNGA